MRIRIYFTDSNTKIHFRITYVTFSKLFWLVGLIASIAFGSGYKLRTSQNKNLEKGKWSLKTKKICFYFNYRNHNLLVSKKFQILRCFHITAAICDTSLFQFLSAARLIVVFKWHLNLRENTSKCSDLTWKEVTIQAFFLRKFILWHLKRKNWVKMLRASLLFIYQNLCKYRDLRHLA